MSSTISIDFNPLIEKLSDNLNIDKEKLKTVFDSYFNKDTFELSTSERDTFEFIVRAQLTCTSTRACTYFGNDRVSNTIFFVKGPYESVEKATVPVNIYKLKKEFFSPLRGANVSLKLLIPDMFSLEECALGLRNKILKDKKDNSLHPFLIFDNMCDEPFATKEVSSKLWPSTLVVDWSKMKTCIVPNIYTLNDETLFSYILNLLFKYIVGIPDLANRNFLHIPSKNLIIGVDEESWSEEDYTYTDKIYKNLKRNLCEYLEKYIDENFSKVEKILKKFYKDSSIEGYEKTMHSKNVKNIIKRLEFILNKKNLLSLFKK